MHLSHELQAPHRLHVPSKKLLPVCWGNGSPPAGQALLGWTLLMDKNTHFNQNTPTHAHKIHTKNYNQCSNRANRPQQNPCNQSRLEYLQPKHSHHCLNRLLYQDTLIHSIASPWLSPTLKTPYQVIAIIISLTQNCCYGHVTRLSSFCKTHCHNWGHGGTVIVCQISECRVGGNQSQSCFFFFNLNLHGKSQSLWKSGLKQTN